MSLAASSCLRQGRSETNGLLTRWRRPSCSIVELGVRFSQAIYVIATQFIESLSTFRRLVATSQAGGSPTKSSSLHPSTTSRRRQPNKKYFTITKRCRTTLTCWKRGATMSTAASSALRCAITSSRRRSWRCYRCTLSSCRMTVITSGSHTLGISTLDGWLVTKAVTC